MSNDTTTAVANPAAEEQPEQQPQPQAPRFKTEAERTASVGVSPAAFEPPESPDAYKISYLDENGAPLVLNDEQKAVDAELRTAAHSVGLTVDEVAHVSETFNRGARLSNDQCISRLQAMWGGAYQQNMRGIAELVGQHVSPTLLELFDAGLGNHVDFLVALHNAASRAKRSR
jgi:hypothetical protein